MPVQRRTTKLSGDNKGDTDLLFIRENVIHFYCSINRSSWIKFNNFIYQMNHDKSVKEIILRISSNGGEVCYGFNIVSLIENSKKPVHGIVDSECHSSALFLLLACKTRKATRCSEFIIHEGCIDRELKTTELLKKYNAEIVMEQETKDYILAKTKITSKQYDILNIDDTIFYTYDAIKYGIITEVV